jgi:alkylation response protein AidB-like acyl-CoA dehydrogenase
MVHTTEEGPAMSATASDQTSAALLEAARRLGPQIRACADQIEEECQLPRPLFEAMASAGLFTILVPRHLGGGGVDPETFARIIEEVSCADGSAGWCTMVPAGTWTATHGFREEVVREVFTSDPMGYVAGSGRPNGRAVVVDGGYRVSGRWPFASGCRHATWFYAECILDAGTQPQTTDAVPERIAVFLAAADCQIIDTWHVTGLRGTGSHDFSAQDVFVPLERTSSKSAASGPRRTGADTGAAVTTATNPGRRQTVGGGFLRAIGWASACLGMARGALDAFVDLAGARGPRGRQQGDTLLRDDPVVQSQFGRVEADLRAARAYLLETAREAWESALGTGDPERAQTLLHLAGTHAAVVSARVVESVWQAAGTSAFFVTSPLERRFRDVHVATQNITVSTTHFGRAGRMFLGADA